MTSSLFIPFKEIRIAAIAIPGFVYIVKAEKTVYESKCGDDTLHDLTRQ
jgi:hypothetical protein